MVTPMRHALRILLLTALLILALPVSALADTGPKDLLTVRVKHAPEEPYYLDILGEGEYEGHTYGNGSSEFSGIDWSYSAEEAAALDEALLSALRSAVPEGWHACTAEGTGGAPLWGELYPEAWDAGGNPLHTFSYVGVPDTYRILIVTEGGETFLSGVCTRQTLQSSVTVDWAAKTVTAPPVWVGYAVQFLCTLLPTLAAEGLMLVLFGFWRQKRNRRVFLGVNLATQGALALWSAFWILGGGAGAWMLIFFLLPAELVILVVETLLYRRLLTGRSRARAAAYGICANLASAALGLYLAEPVWRFVVSIS